MRTAQSALVLLAAMAALPASAQSFNIQATPGTAVPSPAFGAATGQAGTWNRVVHRTLGATVAGPLVDLAGGQTGATAITEDCDVDSCQVIGFGPDVQALFSVFINGDCFTLPSQTRIFGLEPGHYEATLYGTTCFPAPHSVNAYVPGSNTPIALPLSGSYNGTFAQMQLGYFSFNVINAGTLRIVGNTYGSWCALQLTHFDMVSPYCVPKVNSLGCVPTIGWAGAASAVVSSGFVVDCSDALNQKAGLLLYKVGGSAASAPFQGGTLCIGPAGIRRTPVRNSGGSSLPAQDCSGTWSLDMNSFAHGLSGGSPDSALVISGNKVRVQWWGRDPGFGAPNNSLLSDALEYYVLD